jgi:hypothetical protein
LLQLRLSVLEDSRVTVDAHRRDIKNHDTRLDKVRPFSGILCMRLLSGSVLRADDDKVQPEGRASAEEDEDQAG